MRLPENPSDRQLQKIMKRAAKHVGLPLPVYATWVRLDPEAAADELANALNGDRNPERAKQKVAVAFRKSEPDMEAFREWQRGRATT
jgi:Tfp pilus assembly protein PilF